MDLFDLYHNVYLVDVFNKTTNYSQLIESLKLKILKNLNKEESENFKNYSYNLASHYEDIIYDEVKKAFYRGLNMGLDLKDFNVIDVE